MVAKDIPAYRIDSKTSEKKLDTLFRGDFIATLNDSIALEKKDFFVRLENSLSEKTIKFRVFNFKNLLIKDLYVRASDLELNDFEYQESIVMVSNVAPDGASDRAGMKRWDMIVAIDGKTFKDMFEADRIARIEGKEHPLTIF
jgi:predicted metalloprotease with PDZ domain